MEDNFKNINQKMELILTVGQILLENGATTDRIIRNSQRVAAFLNIPEKNFHMQVMPSILFLNVSDGEKSYTEFRNCTKHAINMEIVTDVSQFTRRVLKENYSLKQFKESLEEIISKKKNYSMPETIFATGAACGGFCFLFGGDIAAVFYTMICAMLGKTLQLKLLKFGINEFFIIASSAFAATAAAYLVHFLPSQTEWTPIVACALFLIPGVPIINATIDILNKFLSNGINSALRALFVAIPMATGIVLAVIFFITINPEILPEIENIDFALKPLAEHNIFTFAIAATVAATGFSVIFNIPKKLFLAIGILGAVAVCTKFFFILELEFSPEFATLSGVTVVGFLAIKARQLTNAPMQVLIIPAMIPLVPGVLIYRFLFAFIAIEYLSAEDFFEALKLGIDATQIIFAIAIGAVVPILIATKFFDKKE